MSRAQKSPRKTSIGLGADVNAVAVRAEAGADGVAAERRCGMASVGMMTFRVTAKRAIGPAGKDAGMSDVETAVTTESGTEATNRSAVGKKGMMRRPVLAAVVAPPDPGTATLPTLGIPEGTPSVRASALRDAVRAA